MNLLFRIVYAAHAKGTHHKLALDALRNLKGLDSDLWQRAFLAHAKLYLEGSKAPDDEFKDFKNHVLHTRDGFWGGAPDKVRSWYHHLVEALALKDWQTAAYCAGVLSHYYTDPLQPFHTAQSEAENNIHRAAEWSIAKAYDELYALGERDFPDMAIELPSDPNWLVQLLCRGAERANGYYEKLIAHYDIQRGVVDPPAGLDRVAKRIVAEMIRYAYLSYTAVLQRAIEEANVHAPDVGLTAATLLAAVQVPAKVLARRIADVEERRTIERMYDELLTTGTVEKNLSEDDRVVRTLHAEEVLAVHPPRPEVSKVFPFQPRERVVTRVDRARAARQAGGAQPSAAVIPLRAPSLPAPVVAPAAVAPAEIVDDYRITRAPMLYVVPSMPREEARPVPRRARAGLTDRLGEVTTAAASEATPERGVASAARRFHLTPDQDVVDGPSIGPKTARRLYPHGIKTVRDLVKADPAALSVLVNVRHITAEIIAGWQDQARLMCTVPGLRGTHAQLLVGGGYHTASAIAEAEPDKLCADVLSFAATAAGQRLLRNGETPDIEKIKSWLESARSVRAA
ncbi:MAG: DUF4332 domain-containing protein [Hyphomonadaceae bacterium]|nr:DUF4332 domain-containing protein [Hyphomonadaceae bacterium]